MTENEAIKKIRMMPTALFDDEADKAKKMAIQALEEVQAYRAIGTPTQIFEKIGGLDVELGKYHSIGTIEELKEDSRFLEFLYNHIQPNEMEQYLSMYRMKDKVAVNGYAEQCGLMPAT